MRADWGRVGRRAHEVSSVNVTRPTINLEKIPALIDAARAVGVPLDGHTLGLIGEAIAANMLSLELAPPSTKGYDALDRHNRQVEIKVTTGRTVGLRGQPPDLLAVLKLDRETLAGKVVYFGEAAPAWNLAGPVQKNGQRPLALARLRALDSGRS